MLDDPSFSKFELMHLGFLILSQGNPHHAMHIVLSCINCAWRVKEAYLKQLRACF